jgi:nucleoside 2-deoxyribosyltransferase
VSNKNLVVAMNKFIVNRDLADVARSDLIAVVWDNSKPMRGTSMELAVAYTLRKPIVYVNLMPKPDRVHLHPRPSDHPMVAGILDASEQVYSFEQMKTYIEEYFRE